MKDKDKTIKERIMAREYLDIAGVMFVVIDANQNVSLINKKGCEILECLDEVIIGRNWFNNFVPERIRDEVRTVFRKLMAGDIAPVEYYENPVLTGNGEERIIAWHNTILRDEAGNITGTLSSGEDITERKKAEGELQKTKEALEIIVEKRTTELQNTVMLLQKEINERKKIETEVLTCHERLDAVNQIGALANSTLELDEVLKQVLEGTLRATGASVGMIFLKETDGLSWGASIGLSESFVSEYASRHILFGEGLTGRIAQTGEPIYIAEDSSHDPRIARPVIMAENLNSFIGVPIYAAGEIVGVMNVLSRPPDVLGKDSMSLVTAIGTYIGSAIRNARFFEERKRIEQELLNSESKLRKQKNELENMNIALREIIKQVDIEKEKLRHDVEVNIKNTLLPILSKIKTSDRSEKYYDLLKFHLKELVSSFGRKIVKEDYNLTAREIEICNMIKGGLRSKEICGLLNISFETVEKHRKNIRRKVGISNKKVNLFYFLQKI